MPALAVTRLLFDEASCPGNTTIHVLVQRDERDPIVEQGLDELLKEGVAEKRLRATTNTQEAISETDLSLICVRTPSRKNGSLDVTYLTRVCEQIGDALKQKDGYHVVVVRSTVLPGSTHGYVIPTLEAHSGKKYGEGVGVAVNPEVLREGSALKDFRQPPLTLVGHNHAADAATDKGALSTHRGAALHRRPSELPR